MQSFADWKASQQKPVSSASSTGTIQSFADWKSSQEKPQEQDAQALAPSDTKVNEGDPTTSASGAFASHVAVGVGPALSGLAGFEMGSAAGAELGLFGGPIGAGVGYVAGGIVGSLTASFAADKTEQMALQAVAPEIAKTYDKQGQEHPEASFLGSTAAQLVAFRPGITSPMVMAGGAVAGGGLQAGSDLAQGQTPDWKKVGISAVAGSILMKPTSLGETLASHSKAVAGKFMPDYKAAQKDLTGFDPKPFTVPEGYHTNVDVAKVNEDFNKTPWVESHGLPKDTFRTSDEYGNFLLGIEKEENQYPYHQYNEDSRTDINQTRVGAEESFANRKDYYDKLQQLRARSDMLPHDKNYREELDAHIKQGAPKAHIENPDNPSELDVKNLLYGSKNTGEAVDRLVSSDVGLPHQKVILKALQKNKYLADAKLFIKDHEGTFIKKDGTPGRAGGEYKQGEHSLTLFKGAKIGMFIHEAIHGVTSNALKDPANVELASKFNQFHQALEATANDEEHSLYGLTNPDEMLAEAFSNGKFIQWLKNRSVILPTTKQNAWTAFKDVVKKAFILPKEHYSAFDQVMDLSHELVGDGKGDKFSQWDRDGTTTLENHPFKTKDEILNDYNQMNAKASLEQIEASRIPTSEIPDVPRNDKELVNFWYKLKTSNEVDQIHVENIIRASQKMGLTIDAEEKIRNHFENPDKHVLNDQEQALKEKIYDPLMKAYRGLIKDGIEKGYLKAGEEDPNFFPRLMVKSEADSKTLWDAQKTVMENLKAMKGKLGKDWDNFIGQDQGGFDQNMAKTPGAAQERGLFVHETPGGRTVVQMMPNGNLVRWTDGKMYSYIPKEVISNRAEYIMGGKSASVKAGTRLQGGTIRDAHITELEKDTPYRYAKQSLAVLSKKIMELREQARVNGALDNLMQGNLWKENAVKIDKATPVPDGYKLLSDVNKLPTLAGWAVNEHLANIIEDFARVNTPNALTRISGLIIQNMMLNPIPHMFNEMAHWYLARGLSGFFMPQRVKNMITTSQEAFQEVMEMRGDYIEVMKHGGSFLSPHTRTSSYHDAIYQKGVDESMKNGTIAAFASKMKVSPLKLYHAWSRASSKAMWIVRDTMYLQLIKEHMKEGKNMEEAIAEVDRHMPTYRIPSEVAKGLVGARLGRGLSKAFQNPNMTVFSRYHHGVVKSMIETGKDVGSIAKGDTARFGHGLDTLGAYAMAMAIFYPLADAVGQYMTGNPNAEQRRAGPFHIIKSIEDVASGYKDPQAIVASVFTFNPAVLAVGELVMNRDMYSGRQIYSGTDNASYIAGDIGKYIAKQVPMGQSMMRSGGDLGSSMPQILAQQIDLKAPTHAQETIKEKYHKRYLRASERRDFRERLKQQFRDNQNQ